MVLLIPKTLHMSPIHLDWRMVVFTTAVSLLTGLTFGLAPAWDTARIGISDALREAGQAQTGLRGHHIRNALAVAQITLSLVLLAGRGRLHPTLVIPFSFD